MALAGPLLIALGCAQLDASPVAVNLIGQAGLVLLAVGTLAIARRERLGWDALGLRRPDVITLVGGVALALVYMYVATPVVTAILHAAGSGFGDGLAQVARLPLWNRVLAVLIGGVVEELLFRGYAIARLSAWTRRPWLAGILATVAFALAHVPLWGPAASLALIIPGAVGTAAYLWRRDLPMLMIAHVVTDGAGLLWL